MMCEQCDDDGCPGIQTCPVCHESEHGDHTIDDHGRCYACQKAWECGELDLEDEDDD